MGWSSDEVLSGAVWWSFPARFLVLLRIEDDNFEDEEYDEDEEYGEYDEEEDVAVVEKRAEAKKAAQAKAASASKKTPATKPKAEPAPKQTASSAASAKPLTSEDKQKIELSNRKMNYELSAELFGGVDIASPSRPDFKLPGNQNFETFTPQSEEDFELFATYVGGHLAISGVRTKNKTQNDRQIKQSTCL